MRLYDGWDRDQGSSMAAALAYYTCMALAPVLVLSVLLAGTLFGEAGAREAMVERTRELIGLRGAEVVQGILQSAGRPRESIVALVVSLLALLYGGSHAFQELQEGLSRILAGAERRRSVRKGILRRLISIGLVLLVGVGLVMLMIGGMALDAARQYLELSSGPFFGRIFDYLITFGLGTLFLSMLYRFVPPRHPGWKDACIGASLSAGLFVMGRFLVSLYERTTTAATHGRAGLFVVILIWLYFSAQIVYAGAEVTRLRGDAKAAKGG